MKRILRAVSLLALAGMGGLSAASAQSMEELNLQVHGYATQGAIYNTHNNWNTTDSSDGSAAWTEAVVNLTAQPSNKLRIGVQGRYYLLGDFGNQITLDWASIDYKVNERFGFRVGKVKSPMGMLNETQDVDPGQLWILLPQSIYPLASRASALAHHGGEAYGAIALGRYVGKVEYRAFGGERTIPSDDGFFQNIRDAGLVPSGFTGPTFGGLLIWNSPLQGLLFGGDGSSDKLSGTLTVGPYQGTTNLLGLHPYSLFTKYERNKVMFAGEYGRQALHPTTLFSGQPPQGVFIDKRIFYVMTSYKLADKATAGVYYSSSIDRKAAVGDARYQKTGR